LDNTPNVCAESREVERSSLAADSLRASGRLRLCVRGESMLPSLWPREVVEISHCSVDDARPGEIVLALRDGRFFLHRFVGRSRSGGFLLRGDSMPAPDPEFSGGELLGRVVACSRPLRRWSRAIGQLFCHCGAARRLALKLYSNRQRRCEVEPEAIAVANSEPNPVAARGQECPRYTISELPNAGA
jgi:hypothetical protein